MIVPEQSQPNADLQRWLEEAQAGSDESLQRVLARCREYLAALAGEELAGAAGRETEIDDLVNRALRHVSQRVAAGEVGAAGDVRAWLRAVVRAEAANPLRTPAPTGGPAPARTGGSADTRGPSDSAGHGTPAPPGPAADDGDFVVGEPAAAPEHTSTDPDRTVVDSAGTAAAGDPPQFDGFERIEELGRGGMGVVYRAWQKNPRRRVALKCLPAEFARDPERLDRFRQEVDLAAGLVEHGIVPVYGVLEGGAAPTLVLPLIDGSDLQKVLAGRRQPAAAAGRPSDRAFVDRLLPFFDRVLDALVSLHGAGVLHRDLKPSNILVDKNFTGWLTDFGLARPLAAGAPPEARQALGTRGYMSPEQWAGDEGVDARTDVFAMGVTLYEALTLELPYGKAIVAADTRPAAAVPEPRRRLLPDNLDLVLLKAVHPDRQRRYQSAAELRADWQRVRKGQLPHHVPVGWRRRLRHVARQRTSQAVALGLLLLVAGLAAALVALMAPARPVVRTVRLTTEPPGARVALVPLDAEDGTLRFDKAVQPAERTPVTVAGVPPGDYLVVAEVAGHGFHEVYRRIPGPGDTGHAVPNKKFSPPGGPPADLPLSGTEPLATLYPHLNVDERDGVVHPAKIAIPKADVTTGMAYFAGGEFKMGNAAYGPMFAPPHDHPVAAYYLDKTEVTVAAFRATRMELPVDLQDLRPADGEAMRFVDFDQAVQCAELMGKRLPDEAEYEFAATNGGRNKFPWGDDATRIKGWPVGPAGTPDYDRAAANPAVCGLFSNVAEWTTSWDARYPGVPRLAGIKDQLLNRIVRGGPPLDVSGKAANGVKQNQPLDPCFRQGLRRDTANPSLGFRCARSARPRFPENAAAAKR